MGLFLAMSGVLGRGSEAVAESLARFATRNGGGMVEEARSPEKGHTLALFTGGQNTTALYPHSFFGWDQASQHLSLELDAPVFSIHIHDSDLWMYTLYIDGRECDRFNPIPDYWDDGEDVGAWRGDSDLVAKVASVPREAIERYLVRWGDEVFEASQPSKAYPDDEFNLGDDWQVLDFMKKLNLPYPLDQAGQPRGSTFRFHCRTRF